VHTLVLVVKAQEVPVLKQQAATAKMLSSCVSEVKQELSAAQLY
jgi:hypothetical protein